jgi:hypothetical protein
MPATNRRVERLRQPDDFRKVFALATETALTLVTVVVVSRRMSGAFRGPVSPAVPCLVATFAAVLSLAALALRTAAAVPLGSTRKRILPAVIAVMPPVGLGVALCVSPSLFVGGYLFALATASVLCAFAIDDWAGGFVVTSQLRSILFQSGATASPVSEPTKTKPRDPDGTGGSPASVHPAGMEEQPWGTSRKCHPPIGSGQSTRVTTAMPTATAIVDSAVDEESDAMLDEESESDPSIVQWMTRRRLPDGGEIIEGAVRIDLDEAEKVGVAHLSFSPPLSCDPRAECHPLSDFGGRVRITVAKAYGLRIEARQSSEPTFSTTINVAFSAEAPPAASRAAAA